MSRVIIFDAERDLSDWLEEHDVNIVLRRTNLGWNADFDKPYHVAGSQTATGKSSGDTDKESQIKAIQALVWHLRGCRIGFVLTGPCTIDVPEFTGIEKAVGGARRASELAGR